MKGDDNTIVYCGDDKCAYNRNGKCEHKEENGWEAISMELTLGGQAMCADQREKECEND